MARWRSRYLLMAIRPVSELEKNPDNRNIAVAEKHGVPVRIGGGREEGVFDELNVRRAKSIILATDDDLANRAASSTAETKASAVSGPTPGMVCRVRQVVVWLAQGYLWNEGSRTAL